MCYLKIIYNQQIGHFTAWGNPSIYSTAIIPTCLVPCYMDQLHVNMPKCISPCKTVEKRAALPNALPNYPMFSVLWFNYHKMGGTKTQLLS